MVLATAKEPASRLCAIALLASVLLLCGCQNDAAAGGSDRPRIEVKAVVAPIPSRVIESSVDGRVRTIVEEGATVTPQTVVVELSNATIARDVAYARAQVAAAEARLRATNSHRSPGTDARRHATETILRNKQAKLARYRELFARRDISEQELREAENEVAVAEREWVNEQERATATPHDPELLRLELDKARADQLLAAERQQALAILSPLAGRVVRVFKRPNELVSPREPLVEIVDHATAEIRGEIAPELVRYVAPGKVADVRVMTVPPRRFRRPITRVESGTPGSPPAIVVAVPNPENAFTAGIPATIIIE